MDTRTTHPGVRWAGQRAHATQRAAQAYGAWRLLIIGLLVAWLPLLALIGWSYWQGGGRGVNGCGDLGPVSWCVWTYNPHTPPVQPYPPYAPRNAGG